LDGTALDKYTDTTREMTLLQTGVLGSLLHATLYALFKQVCNRWRPPRLVVYGGFLSITLAVGLGAFAWLDSKFDENALVWMLGYMYASNQRMVLVGYWLLMVVLSVAVFARSTTNAKPTMEQVNLRRKYFHLLAVCMFVPGVIYEPVFMNFSFSFAFGVFLIVETIRTTHHYLPFAQSIHAFMNDFLDARDKGPLITSHLYLLIGCATPVWLNTGHDEVVSSLCGILSIGIGDTMASIVGHRYGRHKWHPTHPKSLQGTLAFVVSVVAVYACLMSLEWSHVLVIVCAAFLETFSLQNDNVILPPFLYALLKLTA
jgi:dolichol kinase